GTFTTRDPAPVFYRHSAFGADPINHTDPTGNVRKKIVDAAADEFESGRDIERRSPQINNISMNAMPEPLAPTHNSVPKLLGPPAGSKRAPEGEARVAIKRYPPTAIKFANSPEKPTPEMIRAWSTVNNWVAPFKKAAGADTQVKIVREIRKNSVDPNGTMGTCAPFTWCAAVGIIKNKSFAPTKEKMRNYKSVYGPDSAWRNIDSNFIESLAVGQIHAISKAAVEPGLPGHISLLTTTEFKGVKESFYFDQGPGWGKLDSWLADDPSPSGKKYKNPTAIYLGTTTMPFK
ncbi:hypothetical protein AB0D08_39645, partial [Kitasatospora sp. NPDC048540]|uniref:hypothetical protein n=2 Tax=unclassified Kitasatospora TaxID=2633591 RepID=UPI003404A328